MPVSPGISMSRNTRSGRADSICWTASRPSWASPTISTSSIWSSRPRRRSRAGSSSSTSIVRIVIRPLRPGDRGSPADFQRLDRHGQRDDGHRALLVAPDGQLRRVAEVPAQPLADVVQAEPSGLAAPVRPSGQVAGVVVEARAAVGDVDDQEFSVATSRHLDRRRTADSSHAVLDGVLHQRLHHHRRDPQTRYVRGGLDLDLQPVPEPGLLDFEVGAGEVHLVLEQRPFALRSAQRVAEDVGELLDRPVGAEGVLVDQSGDGVERVEQEVRVDLRAQGLQLRAASLQRQAHASAAPAPSCSRTTPPSRACRRRRWPGTRASGGPG